MSSTIVFIVSSIVFCGSLDFQTSSSKSIILTGASDGTVKKTLIADNEYHTSDIARYPGVVAGLDIDTESRFGLVVTNLGGYDVFSVIHGETKAQL